MPTIPRHQMNAIRNRAVALTQVWLRQHWLLPISPDFHGAH